MIELSNFSFWICLLTIAVMMGVLQGICAYLILLERKMAAWMQDRVGPNRAGPFGLLQPIADGLKFVLKEEVIPKHVDKLFYLIAPAIAISTALLAFAVVPFGPTDAAPEPSSWPQTVAEAQAFEESAEGQQFAADAQEYNKSYQFVIAPNVNIGFLFVFAVGSLAVYGILLGGWSSNNKYSVMGALRSTAQMISYEIPLGAAILGVFLITGSLNMEKIIDYQVHNGWNVIYQPLACILFITAIFAECNRVPFDLPEAEQELIAGYHTEYSGMKFALFFLGEYTHMITTSFIVMLAFFGGWHFPGLADAGIVIKIAIFAAKMALFIVFYMLIRWTIPRFRFDQLMSIAWKGLIPITMLNVFGILILKHLAATSVSITWSDVKWLLLPWSIVLLIGAGFVALRLPKRESPKKGKFYHRRPPSDVVVGGR